MLNGVPARKQKKNKAGKQQNENKHRENENKINK